VFIALIFWYIISHSYALLLQYMFTFCFSCGAKSLFKKQLLQNSWTLGQPPSTAWSQFKTSTLPTLCQSPICHQNISNPWRDDKAVYKEGKSGCYFLRKLKSFIIFSKMLHNFSMLDSKVLFEVFCCDVFQRVLMAVYSNNTSNGYGYIKITVHIVKWLGLGQKSNTLFHATTLFAGAAASEPVTEESDRESWLCGRDYSWAPVTNWESRLFHKLPTKTLHSHFLHRTTGGFLGGVDNLDCSFYWHMWSQTGCAREPLSIVYRRQDVMQKLSCENDCFYYIMLRIAVEAAWSFDINIAYICVWAPLWCGG